MFKNRNLKRFISIICTILTISYTVLFGCDTVLALKYDWATGTATLSKPLNQVIITSNTDCRDANYIQNLKDDFKFTDYWNFTHENDMTEKMSFSTPYR